jgi:hypothetical protein
LTARHKQVGQHSQNIHLAVIFGQPTQTGFPKTELLLWPPADFV